MKRTISNGTKIIIVIVCFLASVTGFLVKLPSSFRHIDKQLHFSFYFLAAAFFNILFSITKMVKHLFVSVVLLLFGIGIEFAQESYNKVFHSRIHGRFDPEDVKANIRGLVAFSIVWLLCMLFRFAFRATKKTSV